MMRARAALVVFVVPSTLLVACVGDDKYDPLPVPEASEEVPATSSTVPGGIDEVALPAVPGTTTSTAVIGPGPATIFGRVDGPDGPVSGARVRLERLAGDGVAFLEVPTAADGSWNAEGVLGGRYRVRAWLPPVLGMARAQVVFVESPRPKPILLRLERYEGIRVEGVLAPRPPVVGEQANLRVRVAIRGVDERGMVRTIPQPNISVTLVGTGAWALGTANPAITADDGSVTFAMQCQAEGSQPLQAMLPDGQTYPLDLAACVRPPPPTTTTSATTTTVTAG